MKRAVFVIGVFCNKPKADTLLLDTDLKLLGDVADEAGLDAQIVFAIDDARFGGREKYVRATHTKAAHQRVVDEINAHNPEYVFAFGRVALGTILGTGPATLKKYKRRRNVVDDVGAPVFVTDSLSHLVVQSGVAKWIRLDVLAAVEGYNEPTPGEHTILTPDMPEWEVMPDEFKQVEEIGFDLETYPGTSPWETDSRIRMAILTGRDRSAYVVQSKRGRLPGWVTGLCSDQSILKGGSNIAFDCGWMSRFGYEVNSVHDTVTAEHVLDPTDPYKDLKHIALRYAPELGDYDRDFEALRKKRGGWAQCTDEDMFTYAGCDGEASYAAMISQTKLIKEAGLDQAWRLASSLYPVLADMQANGMCIDGTVNREMDAGMQAKLAQLTMDIQLHLGPINPGSAPQLIKALRTHVKEIVLREHEWRQVLEGEDEEATTKRAVLEREQHKHPVIPILLEFRKYNKAHGTYVKGLWENHLALHGGRNFIHPRFTMSTETYRLASSHPSAHQMPRVNADDDPLLHIKRQFISRFPGGMLIDADYGQMEMRIAAQESSDPALLDAIYSGDVHLQTACNIYHRAPHAVSEQMRYSAKTINFGIIYGIGAWALGKLIGATTSEARELRARYFQIYPHLKQFIDDTHAYVENHLEVTTPFGFKRQFGPPPWGKWDSFEGARIKRQGFNTIIQSPAACVMYCALIKLHENKNILKTATVHDCALADSPAEKVRDNCRDIYAAMMSPDTERFGYKLTVPLEVDIEVGKSWGDMKNIVDIPDLCGILEV